MATFCKTTRSDRRTPYDVPSVPLCGSDSETSKTKGSGMKHRMKQLGLIVLLILCFSSATRAESPLKSGDRVVFFGDSWTEQRLYTRFVMDYFTLRYPGLQVSFRNAGWGGDMSGGGLARLQRDVLSLKPTVVSICFGMNDAGYTEFKQEFFDKFMVGMTGIVKQLKQAGIRVVLLTPGFVDTDRVDPKMKIYNDTLGRFGQGVKDLAEKEKLEFCNIHDLMIDVHAKAKAKDPKYSLNETGHPTEPGHATIAYAVLKALGCKDQASGLKIDATKAAATPDRCRVEDLKVQADSISFKRFDEALPMYLPPAAHSALPFYPFTQELNQYNFTVTGLKTGKWKLTVENMEVGTFTDKELAAGVNLATLPGPWIKIGEQVDNASKEQESLYFTQWRGVSMLEVPGQAQAEHKDLLKRMTELVQEQETTRINLVPKDRTWNWRLTWEEAQ